MTYKVYTFLLLDSIQCVFKEKKNYFIIRQNIINTIVISFFFFFNGPYIKEKEVNYLILQISFN